MAQPRAGEWFKTPRDLPGLALILIDALALVVSSGDGQGMSTVHKWVISPSVMMAASNPDMAR